MQGFVGRGIIYQITFCTSAFKFGVSLQANTEAFKNKTQDFREFTRLLLLGLKGRRKGRMKTTLLDTSQGDKGNSSCVKSC